MFVVVICAACGFRFDWYFFKTRPEFVPYVVAALLVKPAVFHGFGMYRRFWRYATIDDMLALALANSAASVAMAGVVWAGLYLGAVREFCAAW
jgi:FlaA1/EpsC-like NDP-sugar epimerase